MLFGIFVHISLPRVVADLQGASTKTRVIPSRLRLQNVSFRLLQLGHVVEQLEDLIAIGCDLFRVKRVFSDIFLKNFKCILEPGLRKSISFTIASTISPRARQGSKPDSGLDFSDATTPRDGVQCSIGQSRE